MARNRYTFYAKIAKKEGFEQIACIFLETAEQEREHAKWLLRHINELIDTNENINVDMSVPTALGTTVENLKAAIAGEDYECTAMYPEFSQKAKEEGLAEIGARLLAIAKAEEHHRERYKKLLREVEAATVHKKQENVTWICRKCGYIHEGTSAPGACPACGHGVAYFERMCETY